MMGQRAVRMEWRVSSKFVEDNDGPETMVLLMTWRTRKRNDSSEREKGLVRVRKTREGWIEMQTTTMVLLVVQTWET